MSHKEQKEDEHDFRREVLVGSVLAVILLSVVIFTPGLASAYFKVEVKICCVGSDSGTHKTWVKLDNGDRMAKVRDFGDLAHFFDDDTVFLYFTFSHSPKTFKACIDTYDNCVSGVNLQTVSLTSPD